jgi:hypothetical protein
MNPPSTTTSGNRYNSYEYTAPAPRPYRVVGTTGSTPMFLGGVDVIEDSDKRQHYNNIISEERLENAIRNISASSGKAKKKLSELLDPNYINPNIPSKSSYNLEECINAFLELEEKGIGDIYLTGSVALAIQGKLDRKEFKDLDIAVLGELQLDDDIIDWNKGFYPPDPLCIEKKSVLFTGIPMDIFVLKDETPFVMVDYNGSQIKCQDYKNIIMAKLSMALTTFKDKDYLFENVLDIVFK